MKNIWCSVLLLVFGVSAIHALSDYCQIQRDRCAGTQHPYHIACSENYEKYPVTEKFVEKILTEHDKKFILLEINASKQKWANGGFLGYDTFPKAANLREIKWSDDLAHVAYESVKRTKISDNEKHDSCHLIDGVEKVQYNHQDSSTIDSDARFVLYAIETMVHYSYEDSFNRNVTDFTKNLASTTKIGCAYAQYPSIVVEHFPEYKEQIVDGVFHMTCLTDVSSGEGTKYTVGTPGSECESHGLRKSAYYPGLCA